jgi:hypothetical protein
MPKKPRSQSPPISQETTSAENEMNKLIKESVETVNAEKDILTVDSKNQTAAESSQLTVINENIMTVALTHKFTSNEIALIDNLPQEQRELFLILADENKKQQLMIQEFFKGFRHVGDAIEKGAEKVVNQVAKTEENIKESVIESEENIKKQAEEIGNGLKNELHDLKTEIMSNVNDLKKQINENKVTTMGQFVSVMYGIFNGIKQGIIAIGLLFVWLHTIWWSWRDPVTGIIPSALSSMIPCWMILTSIFWVFLEWVLITMLIIDGFIYGAVNPLLGYGIDGVGEWLFQLPFVFGIILLQHLWNVGNKVGWNNPIVKGIMSKLMQFVGYMGGKIAKFPLFAKIIYICNLIFAALKTGYSNFTTTPDLTYWFNELLKLVAKKLYDNVPSLWGGKVKMAHGMPLMIENKVSNNTSSEQKMQENENQKIKNTPAKKNVVAKIQSDMYNLAELKSMHEMLKKSRNDLKKDSKPTMDSKWMNQPITLSPKMKGFLNMMLDIPVFIVEFVEYAEKDFNNAIKKMNKTSTSRSKRSQSKRMQKHSNSHNDVSKTRTRSNRLNGSV